MTQEEILDITRAELIAMYNRLGIKNSNILVLFDTFIKNYCSRNVNAAEKDKELAAAKERIAALDKEVERLSRLDIAYRNYINILGEEIDELVPFAASNGWETSRFESGKSVREQIENIRGQSSNNL